MLHFCAGAFGFQVRGLQLEIPLRGAVGVVDQHEVRVVLQAFGLQFHGAAVLLDEFREDEFQHVRDEGDPAEQIPGGDDVDAAMTARDGRDRGQAGEPVFSGANGFGANVGQDEIDGGGDGIGVGVEAQQLVGRGVGAGRVRAHAKAVGDGLEVLLLLVNAVLGAPPPGLVNERAVRGVHEADDAVVDADGHFGLQVGELVFAAEFFDLRRGVGSLGGRGESCAGRGGSGMKTQMKLSCSSQG